MSSAPDADDSGQSRSVSDRNRHRTTPPDPSDARKGKAGTVAPAEAASVGRSGAESARPVSRRRRGRRGQDQAEHSGQARPRTIDLAGETLDVPGATSLPERAGNPDRPGIVPGRSEPVRPRTQESGPEARRRTEGTRPPSQGNGRGLSGSPRNPNHYGEIPIRPDNSVFDATYDRLVCIARSHVIPDEFPVQYRRLTASSRLEVVASLGSDLLLCDQSHAGPHVWPDQTVVVERSDDSPDTNPLDRPVGATVVPGLPDSAG